MGARVCVGVKGSWNCRQEFMQEFRVPRLGVKVYVKVKGSQNCRHEFMQKFKVPRLGARVSVGVKRSWNCRQEFTHESKVLGVGVKIRTGSIRQPWLWAFVAVGNSSRVYESVGESPHENCEFTHESQCMFKVGVEDPESGGILGVKSYLGCCQHFNWSNNLGYELLL
jgi:hypothetical protein